jgi:tetratricopeptide (TPR) repeat protein
VPRFGLRKEIQKQFQASNTTLIPVVVVLYGIGGCGKSQLALEYCQQSENENSYSSIFWIDAMSPSTVEHSFNSLARGLSMPGFDVQNTEASILYVHERLKTWPGRWLLVFDTFDDPPSFRRKSIKDYFPRSRGGSILVTSRVRETILLGYPIDVSTMSEAEALQLLLGRVKRDHEIMSGTDLLEAKKIVERLGFHALAIDQAGAYICLGDYDLNVFLEHYNKRRKAVLSAKPNLWGYKRKLKSNSDFKTELTVFTTWELSFDLITGDQQIRDDKEHLLTLIAFFDKNKISDTLFKLYSSKNSGWMTSCTENGVWDELKLQDILKELRNLSLIQSLRIQQSGATISLHPLIQDWIKLRISHKSQWAYATEAIQVISISIELQQLHETTFEDKQTTVAHINSVIQNKQECLRQENYIEDQFILDGYSKFVLFLEEFGQHKRAEELCRYERKRREELHSLEDPATLGCMSTLAAVLRSQGKYEEAEPLFRQTLALQKMVLGFEHRDTLTAMNNFALLLHSQDSFGEAEPLFRQSLASAETVLGLDDSLTLTIMNNLAYLLDSQGKYEEAEPLFRQTLALQKVVLGPEHVDTLATTNNLAGLFDDQGKSDEAEPLYRQTLALAEIFLGPKHPLTLTVVNNLALLLENQGEYNSAELLLKKTLPLIKEVLGLKHRSTLLAMHLLLRLLVRKCKPDEANPLFWETFTLSESVLGVKHPETLTAMSNLACLLHIQGKYDESESLFLQAIALRKEVLGPEHLNTLYIVDQLRFLLQYKGKEKPKPPLVLSFL